MAAVGDTEFAFFVFYKTKGGIGGFEVLDGTLEFDSVLRQEQPWEEGYEENAMWVQRTVDYRTVKLTGVIGSSEFKEWEKEPIKEKRKLKEGLDGED